jgi:hypothetical protein
MMRLSSSFASLQIVDNIQNVEAKVKPAVRTPFPRSREVIGIRAHREHPRFGDMAARGAK